jgi:hypothetical protein
MNEHADPTIVFVGQGPNQTSWKRGLELGARFAKDCSPTAFAKDYVARLAITGAIGQRLAEMLGISVGAFAQRYHRENLNARWNGKSGKGDIFDKIEGKARAQILLQNTSFTKFVLCGSMVTRCFGYNFAERAVPCVRVDRDTKRQFLIIPHPSRIVAWWNEPFNCFRARRALREFVLR